MPTINTIEDLIQILDEHPHWLEALRARLLTRELIELPEKFAAFVETTNHRLDVLETDVKELKADVKDLKADVETLKTDVKDLKTDVKGLKSDFKGMRDDMGILKGAHARNVAIEDAASIARTMGLRHTRTLSRNELWDLTDAADTTDIPPNALRSFRHADLVMEATDRAGAPCYIAVEIPFTANGRDTLRAVRNAEFLTRFTGAPAHAAIAGLHRDARIQPSIEAGAVFWYQLEPTDLEAD